MANKFPCQPGTDDRQWNPSIIEIATHDADEVFNVSCTSNTSQKLFTLVEKYCQESRDVQLAIAPDSCAAGKVS